MDIGLRYEIRLSPRSANGDLYVPSQPIVAGGTTMMVCAPTMLAALWSAAAYRGLTFARAPRAGGGRRLEAMAGAWTLVVYLSLGIAPWVVHRG